MASMSVGANGSIKIQNNKKTSQGKGNIKRSSMNKSKKRSFKKYRGQG
jgi:hypothetical protein